MQIILKKDVKGTGKAGDVVKVRLLRELRSSRFTTRTTSVASAIE